MEPGTGERPLRRNAKKKGLFQCSGSPRKRVLALTAIAVLAVAAGAYAYFTCTGTGTATASVGTARPSTIKGTVGATLDPGV